MSQWRVPWEQLERRGPDFVLVGGVKVHAGSQVLMMPRANGGGDVFEIALDGRTGTVAEVLQDYEGRVQLAVTVDDDPGRDLGTLRRPGHRFFFSPEEVRPLPGCTESEQPAMRVLLAGVGNVFLGDDGFGVALAERLSQRRLPAGVEVLDFGIRGMDLAYALQDYDALVLLDATPRGGPPGTLYVIEPELDVAAGTPDAHGMDPVRVLALAQALGAGPPPRTLLVGCEPQSHIDPEDERILAQLSEPVRASLAHAVELVEGLVADLIASAKQNQHQED